LPSARPAQEIEPDSNAGVDDPRPVDDEEELFSLVPS